MYQAKVTIGRFGRTWYGKVRKYRWLAKWDEGSIFTLRDTWSSILTKDFHEPGMFMIYKHSPLLEAWIHRGQDEERIA